MKTHSREWFLKQVANARDDIAQWPDWMKEGRRIATASFPQVGEDKKKGVETERLQGVKKKTS
jgi:hypothetical protein